MNTLPPAVLPAEDIEIGGVTIPIRSLSRAQAYALKVLPDEDVQEASVIAWGTGCTLEEAQAWREASGFGEVSPLVDAILRLSGLKAAEGEDDEDAPKD